MSAGFEEFTRAAARKTSVSGTRAAVFERFAVLGGGSDARLLSALCLAEGGEVTLFSAYGSELAALRQGSGIALRSAGPVGSYHVDRDGPSVRLTAELDRAVAQAQVIFLTGAIHKQRTYAMVLADHLSDGQVLVLPQGRSLGAVETAWMLRLGGCRADVTIVELQGLPFWHSAEGSVLTLSNAGGFFAATLPRGRNAVVEGLLPFIGHYEVADSVLVSGFADLTGAVDLPALMMACDAAALPLGAAPLAENATFAAMLGDDQRKVVHALAAERRRVAAAFGVRNLPQTDQWITAYTGALRGDAARPEPQAADTQAILRDGVIGSLVPLTSAANLAGCDVPVTRSMITLAETVLGADVSAAGRRLDGIGVTAETVESARRIFDTILDGGR